MGDIVRDVRYAVRVLAKNPMFTTMKFSRECFAASRRG